MPGRIDSTELNQQIIRKLNLLALLLAFCCLPTPAQISELTRQEQLSRSGAFKRKGGRYIVDISAQRPIWFPLAPPDPTSTLLGIEAGNSLASGPVANSFIGYRSGFNTTNGEYNTFVGMQSGFSNTTGSGNAFFGFLAGDANSTGGGNSFFGDAAGRSNITGVGNTAIGDDADFTAGNLTNATAIGANARVSQSNSLVLGSIAGVGPFGVDTNVGIGTTAPAYKLHVVGSGMFAGDLTVNGTLNAASNFNITGSGSANIFSAATQYNIGGDRVLSVTGMSNVFAGRSAGSSNTTGDLNSFFGESAGMLNTSGRANTFLGGRAGWFNTTGFQNTFVGAGTGSNNTTGSNNAIFGSGAGGFANSFNNSFFGSFAGSQTSTGGQNSFFGFNAGGNNTTGLSNTFVGSGSGFANTTGISNTLVGNQSNVGAGNLTNAAAIGAQALVAANNSLILGSISGINGASADTFVGIGTTAPQQTLHVNGLEVLSTGNASGFKFRNRGSTSSADDWVWYSSGNLARFWRANVGDLLTITTSGIVAINTLGKAGSTALCRNNLNQISTCSSSIRYKQNVNSFGSGLELINRLRPVAFNWKDGGLADFGLIAEEVAEVDPLLATYNDKGEVEGVKYDRIGVVLINAIKEQQEQIEAQRKQIEQQQRQIDALKQLLCITNPTAKVCSAPE